MRSQTHAEKESRRAKHRAKLGQKFKRPSLRDFGRAYDRALVLKESRSPKATPESWAEIIESATAFVGSLNDQGWTFGTAHPDLPQDMRELGELAMALAVADQVAKNKRDPRYVEANLLLEVIDAVRGAN